MSSVDIHNSYRVLELSSTGGQGPAGTVEVEAVETLPSGSEATITNVGTPQNARLIVSIPEGRAGEASPEFIAMVGEATGAASVATEKEQEARQHATLTAQDREATERLTERAETAAQNIEGVPEVLAIKDEILAAPANATRAEAAAATSETIRQEVQSQAASWNLYPTKAEADADFANIPVARQVSVYADGTNNGTYAKPAGATALVYVGPTVGELDARLGPVEDVIGRVPQSEDAYRFNDDFDNTIGRIGNDGSLTIARMTVKPTDAGFELGDKETPALTFDHRKVAVMPGAIITLEEDHPGEGLSLRDDFGNRLPLFDDQMRPIAGTSPGLQPDIVAPAVVQNIEGLRLAAIRDSFIYTVESPSTALIETTDRGLFIPHACSRFRVVYRNRFNSHSGTLKTTHPVRLRSTIWAGDRAIPVSFRGNDGWHTIAAEAEDVSDCVELAIPEGGAWIRVSTERQRDSINEKWIGGRLAIAGAGDALWTGAAVGRTALGSRPAKDSGQPGIWGPAGILAKPRGAEVPSFSIVGSSSADGQGDVTEGPLYQQGYLGRACAAAGFPTINLAQSGSQISQFLANFSHYKDILVQVAPTDVFAAHGSNDIASSATVEVIQGRLLEYWARLAGLGMRVHAITTTPRTTSTDQWRTLENQTVEEPFETKRRQLNAWMLSVPSPHLHAAHDVCPLVEDQTQPGKFIVTGAANYATSDGVHVSRTIHASIAAEFLTNQISSLTV